MSEKRTQKSIGIWNKGKHAKIHDNSFMNLDIGILDEGEDTSAIGNRFEQRRNSDVKPALERKRYETWLGTLLTGIAITLIAGFILFMFGWN